MQLSYSARWTFIIRDAIKRAGLPAIENVHSTGRGTASYFTDPDDGLRYRITLEPIKESDEPKQSEPTKCPS